MLSRLHGRVCEGWGLQRGYKVRCNDTVNVEGITGATQCISANASVNL